ncbi:MAG: site-specific DNA-methyltransferase [Armatimonadetes bacterium]|nr:site-specific DNA-methyltransferase [Armatimonadota bacterium]MDE2206717.1 site-specific DNA-methyltransferase [Armatimonadota bacterium]
MDGLVLLGHLPVSSVPLVMFDPQYRSVLDRQAYGNEGDARGRKRAELPQMETECIKAFIAEIVRVLVPGGHLMLWVDKYILCSGVTALTAGTPLHAVDMVTWDKLRMGMGYRTRRRCEHLVIFQLPPLRAKGVWQVHDIADVWPERSQTGVGRHTHAKPLRLQQRLIEAVTSPGELVVDPAAGGFSVMTAARAAGREFLGCDILG